MGVAWLRPKLKQNLSFYNYTHPALHKSPHKKGGITRTKVATPKKPNSGRRPIANAFLTTERWVWFHIPGHGHNIRKYSKVLIRAGGARDLSGIRYSCIRGPLDCAGVLRKRWRRSIYGTKKDLKERKHYNRGLRIYKH